MFFSGLKEGFEGVEINVLELLEADATFANFHVAEFGGIGFCEILVAGDAADVETDVVLLIREGDDRPISFLFFGVEVVERTIPYHIAGKVSFESRNGLLDEIVQKREILLPVLRDVGKILLDGRCGVWGEHVHEMTSDECKMTNIN